MFEDDGTETTVCMEHLRFIPCRHCDEPTIEFWSTDPDIIRVVAAYQEGKLELAVARFEIGVLNRDVTRR